jgi:SAM-dependent methyltransferase
MGITTHMFRAILREHKYAAYKDKGLLLGRQSIFFDEAKMKEIAYEENVPLKKLKLKEDVETRSGGGVLDFDLFNSFTDMNVEALDVTDYEGANIIHDMNKPIPSHLHNQFDFLYNGSCMDNLFNPSQFLQNCTNLLKPGGRFISIEHGSSFPGGYLFYSPDWFLDFFALNNFKDAVVFVADFLGSKSPHHIESPWFLWNWNPLYHGQAIEHSMHNNPSNRLILVIAEKGDGDDVLLQPVQGQYRTDDLTNKPIYEDSYNRFIKSPRLEQYRNLKKSNDWANYGSVSNLSFTGTI